MAFPSTKICLLRVDGFSNSYHASKSDHYSLRKFVAVHHRRYAATNKAFTVACDECRAPWPYLPMQSIKWYPDQLTNVPNQKSIRYEATVTTTTPKCMSRRSTFYLSWFVGLWLWERTDCDGLSGGREGKKIWVQTEEGETRSHSGMRGDCASFGSFVREAVGWEEPIKVPACCSTRITVGGNVKILDRIRAPFCVRNWIHIERTTSHANILTFLNT